MQFKVKDIGDEGVDVDLPITAVWLARECAGAEVSPGPDGLRFSGRLERSGHDFLLRGELAGSLVTPCARCLEPAALPLEVDVSVIYVEKPEARAASQGQGQGDDDEDLDAPDVIPFTEGVIDLAAEMREEILLALPVSVLCREDCLGLCPICGGNRNLKPCDCVDQQRARESKFAVLARLKS